MSESDNPSSPKNEEMDVSENGDTNKATEESDRDDSKAEEPVKEEEEEEEDEEEEEPPLGLLERPVELTSGKREKKKVERLDVSVNMPSSDRRKKLEIQQGAGTKLGDCPRIEFKLNRTKAKELLPLHRLLYSQAATALLVKKNIRQFSGFTFGKGDKDFDKRVTSLNKMTLPGLKMICEVLDIERGGTKSAIIERIMDFLFKPSSSGLPLPQDKKRKSKGGDADKKGVKRKRSVKKKEKKSKSKKDTVSDISDSDDEEEEEKEEEEEEKEEKKEKNKKSKAPSDNEEEEEEEEEDEEEKEEPPKKKAKAEKKPPAKKEPAKKETAKAKKQNGKQEKPAKTEKKEVKKKKKAESDDSDSDDEPIKPEKKEPPANSELKEVIKKILDGANLEEVTMKTVVKQVYEKYPSFDLTDRKDFIKSTVREIIS